MMPPRSLMRLDPDIEHQVVQLPQGGAADASGRFDGPQDSAEGVDDGGLAGRLRLRLRLRLRDAVFLVGLDRVGDVWCGCCCRC